MKNVRKLVMAGVCLALCLILPFFTGQLKTLGNMLSPMHFPVLICGFVCGPVYGLAVGAIAPILRYFLFGMPPLMPTGVAMAFELAAYGALAGLFYRLFPRKTVCVYGALIAAMLAGRLVWGVVSWILYGVLSKTFTLQIFLAGAFWNAVPGIVLQVVLIPPIVLALKRAGLAETEERR